MDNDDGGNDHNDGCGCHVEKRERCRNIFFKIDFSCTCQAAKNAVKELQLKFFSNAVINGASKRITRSHAPVLTNL